MIPPRAAALASLLAVAGCSGADKVDLSQDPGSGGSGATTGTGATSTGTGSTGTGTTSGSTTTSTTTSTSSTSTTAAGGAGQGGGGAGQGGSGGQGGAGPADAGADAGPVLVPVVYAHSASTLYKLDPVTKAVKVVGDFQGCSSVIDLAIDKAGSIWVTTFGGLYTLDPTTAKCALVAMGSYPNSLSFVPAGTLDPNVEALVGYQGSTYVRIDPASGAVTTIGDLGQGYASSGDVVSVIGGATYLTVNGNGCGDCIVEVNPKTGALVKKIGQLKAGAASVGSVFGLAYWAGVAYGFDDAGELVEIDLASGASTFLPIPNAPPNLSFWGAGSTTAAPLHQ